MSFNLKYYIFLIGIITLVLYFITIDLMIYKVKIINENINKNQIIFYTSLIFDFLLILMIFPYKLKLSKIWTYLHIFGGVILIIVYPIFYIFIYTKVIYEKINEEKCIQFEYFIFLLINIFIITHVIVMALSLKYKFKDQNRITNKKLNYNKVLDKSELNSLNYDIMILLPEYGEKNVISYFIEYSLIPIIILMKTLLYIEQISII